MDGGKAKLENVYVYSQIPGTLPLPRKKMLERQLKYRIRPLLERLIRNEQNFI